RRLGVLLPEVRDDFGVAVGAEGVPAGLKGGPLFRVVEQLAVVGDGDAAVLVEDRLSPVRQPDNAQPPRRQPQSGGFAVTVLIRPTVEQAVGHRPQGRGRNRTLGLQIHHPRDAAHRPILRSQHSRYPDFLTLPDQLHNDRGEVEKSTRARWHGRGSRRSGTPGWIARDFSSRRRLPATRAVRGGEGRASPVYRTWGLLF